MQATGTMRWSAKAERIEPSFDEYGSGNGNTYCPIVTNDTLLYLILACNTVDYIAFPVTLIMAAAVIWLAV